MKLEGWTKEQLVKELRKAQRQVAELERSEEGYKKERKALVEDLGKYRTFFENANDAIFFAQGPYFVDCNKKTLEMFGCREKGEIIGRAFYDVSPERQPDGLLSKEKGLEKNELAYKGIPQFFEWKLFRLDGTPFDVEVSLNKINMEGEDFHQAIIRDITGRKEREESLRRALEEIEKLKRQLESDYTYLREEIKLEHNFDEIIGKSNRLRNVLRRVEQIAPTNTTVLILGETGVGKELFARAIHNASPRKDRPLVKINCATLPPNLIESELFGHEKGAFTGALSRHVGRFELADGATILLDEIGELPLELQVKLLRVLQDGEFERLGSSRPIRTDVRVIAATNRNLEEDIHNGRFREDLWYRLNVFPITVPPLRERKEDVPLLVQWFVNGFAKKLGKPVQTISKRVMNTLQTYPWPGNVRELENVIERSVIVSQGTKLEVNLPRQPESPARKMSKKLEDVERTHILRVLEETYWKISGKNGAAEVLGMKSTTLRSRMRKLGIKKPIPRS